MLYRFAFPLLAVALLATEASQAQAVATTPIGRPGYRKAHKAERVLSKREQQAAAREQAAALPAAAPAVAQAPASAGTTWSGWSNEAMPVSTEPTATHRATSYNVSVAPGMPVNQLGHGVSTDYHGRPLTPATASTTLPNVR